MAESTRAALFKVQISAWELNIAVDVFIAMDIAAIFFTHFSLIICAIKRDENGRWLFYETFSYDAVISTAQWAVL